MQQEDGKTGSYCIYPPQVWDQVDVTEQTEGTTTRYVVRNRTNARYFLLRQTEFQVFNRIDGTRILNDIAAPSNGTGPRASRQAILKFLGKLDSLGLLGRGGPALAARAPTGLYPRFSLFNPDRFLAWLDRRIGRLLCRPVITASLVMMAAVARGMLIRSTETAAYTS